MTDVPRLILYRVVSAIALLLIVTGVVFLLSSLIPGDPARVILGENATPAAVEALREQLGLNRPQIVRYIDWLSHALRGDLGQSIYSGVDVTRILNSRIPVSASLVILSTIVISVVGITLGMVSALRGGWLGRALDAVSLLGLALPGFLVAIILVATFAVTLSLFPATGYVPLDKSPNGWLQSLVLPVVTLSLPGATIVAKQMRDSAMDVLDQPYVRVLRASGISETSVTLRHVLRNASIPTVTMIGLGAIATLTGSVFIENVFVLPGLGQVAVSSTLTKDLPVLLGASLYFTIFVIIINLLVDFTYGLLNPKLRVR